MTSAEFTESLAFEQLEPDPAEVTMRLIAQLVASFHNVYRDIRARPRPFSASDFLPPPINAEQIVEDERDFNVVIAEMRAAYASRQRGRN
jgi:hypothetical protein